MPRAQEAQERPLSLLQRPPLQLRLPRRNPQQRLPRRRPLHLR